MGVMTAPSSLSALALMVSLMGAMAQSPAAPEQDPVQRVQSWLDSWSRLQGRFQQAVASPTLPREQVESGEFAVMRPDRMRWDYREPESKLALTDGTTTWLYLPEDRQVIRGRLEDLRRDGALALLLSGGLRLQEAFRVERAQEADGALELSLVPAQASEAMARIDLVASPDGAVRAFTVHDPAGNRVRWTFQALQRDPPLSPERFRFTIPPGVEVQEIEDVTDSSP